jgi:hypothetical protein
MVRTTQKRYKRIDVMKVIGLDEKEYTWNPASYILKPGEISGEKSSYHVLAHDLLKSLFPTEKIIEEVGLPGTKPMLFADFLVPLRKLIIETHGEQHYKWVPYYHTTKREFLRAKHRDEIKKT